MAADPPDVGAVSGAVAVDDTLEPCTELDCDDEGDLVTRDPASVTAVTIGGATADTIGAATFAASIPTTHPLNETDIVATTTAALLLLCLIAPSFWWTGIFGWDCFGPSLFDRLQMRFI